MKKMILILCILAFILSGICAQSSVNGDQQRSSVNDGKSEEYGIPYITLDLVNSPVDEAIKKLLVAGGISQYDVQIDSSSLPVNQTLITKQYRNSKLDVALDNILRDYDLYAVSSGNLIIIRSPIKLKSNRHINVDFTDTPITEVIKTFFKGSGLKYSIASNLKGTVNLKLTDVEFSEAVTALRRSNNLIIQNVNGVYFFTSKPNLSMIIIKAKKAESSTNPLVQDSRKRISVNLVDVPLKDAIDSVFKAAGYAYTLSPAINGASYDNIHVSMKFENVTTEDAIAGLLTSNNLMAGIQDNTIIIMPLIKPIVISENKNIDTSTTDLVSPEERISVDLKEVPLKDAIDVIFKNAHLNWTAIAKVEKNNYILDPALDKPPYDKIKVSMKLDNVAVNDAIRGLLTSNNLKVRIENGIFFISPLVESKAQPVNIFTLQGTPQSGGSAGGIAGSSSGFEGGIAGGDQRKPIEISQNHIDLNDISSIPRELINSQERISIDLHGYPLSEAISQVFAAAHISYILDSGLKRTNFYRTYVDLKFDNILAYDAISSLLKTNNLAVRKENDVLVIFAANESKAQPVNMWRDAASSGNPGGLMGVAGGGMGGGISAEHGFMGGVAGGTGGSMGVNNGGIGSGVSAEHGFVGGIAGGTGGGMGVNGGGMGGGISAEGGFVGGITDGTGGSMGGMMPFNPALDVVTMSIPMMPVKDAVSKIESGWTFNGNLGSTIMPGVRFYNFQKDMAIAFVLSAAMLAPPTGNDKVVTTRGKADLSMYQWMPASSSDQSMNFMGYIKPQVSVSIGAYNSNGKKLFTILAVKTPERDLLETLMTNSGCSYILGDLTYKSDTSWHTVIESKNLGIKQMWMGFTTRPSGKVSVQLYNVTLDQALNSILPMIGGVKFHKQGPAENPTYFIESQMNSADLSGSIPLKDQNGKIIGKVK